MSRTEVKTLDELAGDLEVIGSRGTLEIPVRGIAYHSEAVEPGFVFVAIAGNERDGHDFVRAAMQRGAVGAVVEELLEALPAGFTQIRVANARRALAMMANRFYGFPARSLTLVGLTGTNGKTTTAYILESILERAGHRVGVVGTIDYRFGGRSLPAATTTPQSLDLQRLLRQMLDAGTTHVLMEVTSHALDQHRVLGCPFTGAVFTNLSRDHLDYHGDTEAYLAAKLRLFEESLLPESQGGWAVINAQDPASGAIEQRCQGRVIRFGEDASAEFQILRCDLSSHGTRLEIRHPGGRLDLATSLLGRPNSLNVLAACACAWALGIEAAQWSTGLQALGSIPGRFEPISNDQGVMVVVDYAHTSDALERVLASARQLVRGKLICVFGCGGDRDRGKRPLMGQAAARHSDYLIITSDNPRSEPPAQIIEQIVEGLRDRPVRFTAPGREASGGPTPAYTILEDREEAIHCAIRSAQPGDVVLIAGKGHETHQILGSRRIPLDDREVARQALRELGS